MSCTKKQEALIRAAFDAIPEVTDGFSMARNRLYDKALASEKLHRHAHGAQHYHHSFPATLAARYFAVKWLREYALGKSSVTVADYLRIREDAFYAAAVASANFNELWPWAQAVDAAFDALDYAELVA